MFAKLVMEQFTVNAASRIPAAPEEPGTPAAAAEADLQPNTRVIPIHLAGIFVLA